MERKTISVIALDPRAARSYGRDVESLFGDVADISVFSVRDGTAMGALPRADAASVPIIAVTANVFSEDIDRTMRAGMNGHIPKPVDAAALGRVMQQLISEREHGKRPVPVSQDQTDKEAQT